MCVCVCVCVCERERDRERQRERDRERDRERERERGKPTHKISLSFLLGCLYVPYGFVLVLFLALEIFTFTGFIHSKYLLTVRGWCFHFA